VTARQDRGKDAGPAKETSDRTILHASCVAVGGRGLLILGASGSGKSGLALAMMAFGADLVADDRVILTKTGNGLIAKAPERIDGLIEARGIGLLNAHPHGPVPVFCAVDLDQTETVRMPPLRQKTLLGHSVTLLLKVDSPHFPAAMMQYLGKGRRTE
jgi:HPr kinase/phosphorylase